MDILTGPTFYFYFKLLRVSDYIISLDTKSHILRPRNYTDSVPWGSFTKYVRKIFRKINNSYLLICTRTCAYEGVRNVSFSENFVKVLSKWSHVRKNLHFFSETVITKVMRSCLRKQFLKYFYHNLLAVIFRKETLVNCLRISVWSRADK